MSSSDRTRCIDVDECSDGTNACPAKTSCVNILRNENDRNEEPGYTCIGGLGAECDVYPCDQLHICDKEDKPWHTATGRFSNADIEHIKLFSIVYSPPHPCSHLSTLPEKIFPCGYEWYCQ